MPLFGVKDINSRIPWKTTLLIAIFLLGLITTQLGFFSLEPWIQKLEAASQNWWMPITLIGLMLIFYALALPGTLFILGAGAFYPPATATLISVIGGVTGGVAAFFLAQFLSSDWTRSLNQSYLFSILQRHSGFLPLCILRIFPGFPHSAINYSSGLLRKELSIFILSSIVGLSVKGFVYTSAVYNTTHLQTDGDNGIANAVWPLAAIVLLTLSGYIIKNLFFNGHRRQPTIQPKDG